MSQWNCLRSIGIVSLAFLLSSPALSLEMKISGNTVFLSGTIANGDEFAFKDLIEGPTGKAVRIVRLNSGGGFVNAAGEIGRVIRKHKLTTLVDAASGRCSSACTLLFGAGVQRHYIGAGAMQDSLTGNGASRGLAFHEGSASLSRAKNKYSGQATAEMIGWYYEFGISRAKDFITKAPPEKMFQMSGATALSSGIATSLSKP